MAGTPKGVNQRDIGPAREVDAVKHVETVADYHANMMPPPDAPWERQPRAVR